MADWTGATYQDKRYTSTCCLVAAPHDLFPTKCSSSVDPAFMSHTHSDGYLHSSAREATQTRQHASPLLGELRGALPVLRAYSWFLYCLMAGASRGRLEGQKHAGVRPESWCMHHKWRQLEGILGEKKVKVSGIFLAAVVKMLYFISRQVLISVWWWKPICIFPWGGWDELPAGGYSSDTENRIPEESDAVCTGNVLSETGSKVSFSGTGGFCN